jgi:glutamyl-tRNA synthetase
MAHLTEASDLVGPFYVADDAVEVADDARAQLTDDAATVLDAAVTALEALPDDHVGVLGSDASFTASAVEAALREALVDGLGLKPRFAFGPLRTAVSGRRVSPPLFESMEILGKASTLVRLRALRATR